MSNATQVWQNFVCQVSPTDICITTGRLNPTLYDQMIASVDVCSRLQTYGPFLVELEDCTFVRETFINIYKNECPKLQQHSSLIYIGLVMVSTAVMLSIIFWVIYGRERRHRVCAKQLKAESNQGFEDDKRSQS